MSEEPIRLDGSEGGGQILRTALALSLVTQRPFQLKNIRFRRENPGLRPHHLACLKAAEAVSGANVRGAEVGSDHVTFEPGPVRSGSYLLDIGTVGSVPLLLQAIAFPLALARAPSTLRLRGGTHVPRSPTFHDLSLVWLPAMRELGWEMDLEMRAAGFYPEGGGEVTATLSSAGPPVGLERRSRGTLAEVRVLSMVSNLPFDIAGRQSERAVKRLKERGIMAEAENLPLPAPRSRGTSCLVLATFERGRAAFSALGERGRPAEQVGEEAADHFLSFMESRGAVDPHLSDQLLVPLSLAAAGLMGPARPVSWFTTSSVTDHLVTNASVIGQFLDVEIAILAGAGAAGEVRVAPRSESLVAAVRSAAQV